MTAVVGILNKQAIALAADSAVTIGSSNGSKIFNQANKLFTLSKRHPVGIMIYNSATFMSTPWEIIIKIYRQQLGERSFTTLKEYQVDFLNFIKSKDYYTSDTMQLDNFEHFSFKIIEHVIKNTIQKNRSLFENLKEEDKSDFVDKLKIEFNDFHTSLSTKDVFCDEFLDYSFVDFNKYTSIAFDKVYQNMFLNIGVELPPDCIDIIKRVVYLVLKIKEDESSYTGLIFCGFGESEIYPQLIAVNISFVLNNRLRYYINESQSASISNENDATICPFAQTDVIDTILSGIDPSLNNIYLNNFQKVFDDYNQMILANLDSSNQLLIDQIKSIDTSLIINEINTLNNQIQRENYIDPLMNAVGTLSKEDLAEMAESLIYLTYLKRRITFAEESVGGPVDVAIISKGDGFIWIKRKNYFKPELNQYFFDNYYN